MSDDERREFMKLSEILQLDPELLYYRTLNTIRKIHPTWGDGEKEIRRALETVMDLLSKHGFDSEFTKGTSERMGPLFISSIEGSKSRAFNMLIKEELSRLQRLKKGGAE